MNHVLTSLALGLLLALGGGQAAAEQQYAVTQIRVAGGGNPVAGTVDGILFTQTFDSECALTAGDSGALAATLASEIDLEITVAACPETAAEPEVRCDWIVERKKHYDSSCRDFASPPSLGRGSWQGSAGTVSLAAPISTGEYVLLLGCLVDGEPARSAGGALPVDGDLPVDDPPAEALPASDLRGAELPRPTRTTFYVTYADPLAAFSPPQADWYERATCWGGGLHARATEADVLNTILEGIYRYGQEHWRYGYAEPQDSDAGDSDESASSDGSATYLFPLFSSDAGTSNVEYVIQEEAFQPTCFPPCKCTWIGLVTTDSPCNFADCYVFSDVLQGISAVMGVGGLVPLYIAGDAQVGFVTQPAASLDPAFKGSITCADTHETCYPYYFSSHSLRARDGVFYDATFDQVYSTSNESIGLSKAKSNAQFMKFVDSSRTLLSLGTGYGGWGFYFDPPGPGSHAQMPRMPAGRALKFTGDVTFSTADSSISGIYSNVVAEVGVEILIPGQYLVHGELLSGGVPVARRAYWSASMPSTALVVGPPGPTSIQLKLSGQEILESAIDGPYDFIAMVAVRPDEVEVVNARTPAYKYQSFGEKSATIDQGIETQIAGDDGDDRAEMSITVPVIVQASGGFGLEARLSQGGVTIAYAGTSESLVVGRHTVDLEIPGQEIAASGLPGPYDLTILLYDSDLEAIDNARTTVQGLEAASFE